MLNFQQKQFQLANVIKFGESKDIGVEQRRIKIYQDLFFNNVEGFCANAFPVVKSLFSEAQWQGLVRQFFTTHKCETPHFVEISTEFLEFLAEADISTSSFPFLLELAHYEWVELASSIAQSDHTTSVTGQVYVPESTFALSYQYPVHEISADNKTNVQPQQTFLIVYRNEDYNVKFLLVDALSVILLQQASELDAVEIKGLVNALSKLLPDLNKQELSAVVESSIARFLEKGILLRR